MDPIPKTLPRKIAVSTPMVAKHECWFFSAVHEEDCLFSFGAGYADDPKTLEAITCLFKRGFDVNIEFVEKGLKTITVIEKTDVSKRPHETVIDAFITELGGELSQLVESKVNQQTHAESPGSGICINLNCVPAVEFNCPIGYHAVCNSGHPISCIPLHGECEHD